METWQRSEEVRMEKMTKIVVADDDVVDTVAVKGTGRMGRH